jgi:hypothetical protein
VLDRTGIPESARAGIESGWEEDGGTPMRAYFAKQRQRVAGVVPPTVSADASAGLASFLP